MSPRVLCKSITSQPLAALRSKPSKESLTIGITFVLLSLPLYKQSQPLLAVGTPACFLPQDTKENKYIIHRHKKYFKYIKQSLLKL